MFLSNCCGAHVADMQVLYGVTGVHTRCTKQLAMDVETSQMQRRPRSQRRRIPPGRLRQLKDQLQGVPKKRIPSFIFGITLVIQHRF